MLEPQMAAAAAEDITLDPQILAIKRKEQRKVRAGAGREGGRVCVCDDGIQALDWDIGVFESQMAAAAAEDITLDPQIPAIKRKEQRKVREGGGEEGKVNKHDFTRRNHSHPPSLALTHRRNVKKSNVLKRRPRR